MNIQDIGNLDRVKSLPTASPFGAVRAMPVTNAGNTARRGVRSSATLSAIRISDGQRAVPEGGPSGSILAGFPAVPSGRFPVGRVG